MNTQTTVPPVIKLVIAAVPYSSNLGDGAINDMMVRILQDTPCSVAITALDISGRRRYAGLDQEERNKRRRGLGIIKVLPAFLRKYLVLAYVTLNYLCRQRRAYAAALEPADHVIIGGGQLFTDLDLNFPAKLFWLHHSLRRYKVPFSIYAVGASDNWTMLGRYCFRTLLHSPLLRGITARDQWSEHILAREIDKLRRPLPVTRVWDPAVATSLFYPRRPATVLRNTPLHLGINIADLGLLASAGDQVQHKGDGMAFFLVLLNALKAFNYRVTLFTNGAEEDERFLDRLMQATGGQYSRAERPLTPQQLITQIQTFDYVISHRLHANIICYSYGIAGIGLDWDRKVSSFFALTGRSDCLVATGTLTTDGMVLRILEILATLAARDNNVPTAAILAAKQQLSEFSRTRILASLPGFATS